MLDQPVDVSVLSKLFDSRLLSNSNVDCAASKASLSWLIGVELYGDEDIIPELDVRFHHEKPDLEGSFLKMLDEHDRHLRELRDGARDASEATGASDATNVAGMPELDLHVTLLGEK